MSVGDAIKGAIGFFAVIVGAALLSSALGAAFGALVAAISPEFVGGLFGSEASAAPTGYAAVVGMIWGLFIGAAAAGFACFLAAVIKIFRVRLEFQKGQAAAAGAAQGRG